MTVRLLMPLYNRVGKGTYWRALGFAEALSRQGYEVTLLAVAANRKRGFAEREINGVKLVETPDLLPSSGYDLWDALNRIAWVRRRPFDLIHAFETRPVNIFPALYARKRYNVPLLTDWCDWFGRGGSVEQRPNWLLRTVLRPIETFFEERFRPGAAGTTAVNNILRQKALALGVPAERLLLLPNGANVNDIWPQPKEQIRAKLGLPTDAIILGYTGALFVEDARLMAAAFDAIQAELPQARLLLIGYSNFPVEEMVKVKAAVQRTGPVNYERLADYVAACDAGWLPLADNAANRGRFPMKAHDFMAAGRPLIVTDVGDLGPFVRQWQIGHTAEAAAAPLAETVLTAVAQPDILRQQGEQARRVAEEQFAWPVVAAKLDSFYQKVRKL